MFDLKSVIGGFYKQFIIQRFELDETDVSLIREARALAKETVRASYSEIGILAGSTHFSDLWVRDCCYASFGSLAIGDLDIVKKSLETMLEYTLPSGQVPLRIGDKHFLLKYIGLTHKTVGLRPLGVYKEDKPFSGSLPMDSNPLCIIMAARYGLGTGDVSFLESHFETLKKSMDWCFSFCNEAYLIEEGCYAGWADSLKKKGCVLYTNVLFYESLKSFLAIIKKLNKRELFKPYSTHLSHVEKSIQTRFWNGNFFDDFIDKSGPQKYFSTDGNLLACLFDLATPNQADSIYEYMKESNVASDFCIQTNTPEYPKKVIFTPFRWIGLGDYHNGLRWLWLGCLDIIVRSKYGRLDEAKFQLKKLSQKILEFEGVYEVYNPSGTPVKRLFYKSEKNFAWSAGLFLSACRSCEI
ncbi:hypothetical protein DID77_02965 [Candidatus Marinamargulisbacteria bacterium SCGC AG-439-L15]|nr:hypothetical protein DID77_02965 [Candidatus Marinamargulisbacteria bacterium SCGC AG-439-L15]